MILPLYDSSGQQIQLEASIATGGEGSIHRLRGRNGLLAKIYSVPPDTNTQLKLRELLKIKSPALQQFSAWPQELLFEHPQGQTIVGFLMTDFEDSIELKDLFADSSRIFHFPQLTWTGLIQLAENIARAVNIAHKNNLVIGDLHPRNILVNKSVIPRLIDCDSYQITTPQRVFRSIARLPDYLPPELHGVDVSKLDGTPNHDLFGLAMIIFQCLFVGRNPFSGQFLGQGDLELETAIKQQRYAYGPGARQRLVEPPADALQLDHMTPEIAHLFERAFLTIKNRPTAADWIAALNGLRKQITACSVNRSHSRLKSQSKCPFCELQQKNGVALFPNLNAENIVKANSAFTVPPECGQLKTLNFPAVQLPVPPASIIKTNAVLPPRTIDYIRFEISCIAICGVAVLLTLFSSRMGIRPGIPAAIALACVAAKWIAHSTSPLHETNKRLRLQSQRHESNAQTSETVLSNYLNSQASNFNQLIREGEDAVQKMHNELARKTELAAKRKVRFEEQQRKDWLRSHKILPNFLPKLNAVQCQQLNAMGLMTAADILPHRLDKANFLSPEQRQHLHDWVTSTRNSFHCPAFRPSLTPGVFRSEFQLYSICTTCVSIVRDRLATATGIANAIPSLISPNIAYIAHERALAADADDQILQLQELYKSTFERTMLASVVGIVFLFGTVVSTLEQRSEKVRSARTSTQSHTVAQTSEEFSQSVETFEASVPPIRIESVIDAANASDETPETTTTTTTTTTNAVKVQNISFQPPEPLSSQPPTSGVKPSASKPISVDVRAAKPIAPVPKVSRSANDESARLADDKPKPVPPAPEESWSFETARSEPEASPSVDARSLFATGVQFFHAWQSVAADSAFRKALAAPDPPIETGFFLAINTFRLNEPAVARQQLRNALIRANGCTPQQVVIRLSTVQGRDRQWFEFTRCELENELRHCIPVEQSSRRFSQPRRRASNKSR